MHVVNFMCLMALQAKRPRLREQLIAELRNTVSATRITTDERVRIEAENYLSYNVCDANLQSQYSQNPLHFWTTAAVILFCSNLLNYSFECLRDLCPWNACFPLLYLSATVSVRAYAPANYTKFASCMTTCSLLFTIITGFN